MTATQTKPSVLLSDLLPEIGPGTLAHLEAANLRTVQNVEDRAEALRIATFRVFLIAGLPMTLAGEFCESIHKLKTKGRVA